MRETLEDSYTVFKASAVSKASFQKCRIFWALKQAYLNGKSKRKVFDFNRNLREK